MRLEWCRAKSMGAQRIITETARAHLAFPDETTAPDQHPTYRRIAGTMVTAKHVKPLELLLVEDSPAEIFLIRNVLARESVPVSIHVAVDGKQASEILAAGQFKPNLVLLDLNLPKQSGLSVLELCRPHVPVVVFSSSTNPDDIQRSFQLGVRDFVPKPSDLESYKRVVSYIVQTWGAKDSGAEFER